MGSPWNDRTGIAMPAEHIDIRAEPISLDWHPGLPVFATEGFLKAVGDEYGWLGGIDYSGNLQCVLPYTIIRKAIFRMVRFRVETIPLRDGLSIEGEKSFLNSCVEYFRAIGADVIIPATTNAIFRVYPDGANAAPYGSYVIDLRQPEDVLWKNIGRITRQNIGTAEREGVHVRSGIEHLDLAYALIKDTFQKSQMPFMNRDSLQRFMLGLGENGKLMIAEYKGVLQSCVIFAFSDYCAYAIYAGNVARQHQGANKLIYWEAIRLFKKLGIKRFDFVGGRIDPTKGSKEEAINLFKQRMGAKLIRGFIWKYPLRPLKSLAYSYGVRLFRGGDIVDLERHKLETSQNIPTSLAEPCQVS
jgi:hypothetical protein